MQSLESEVRKVSSLSVAERADMFALYDQNYAGAVEDVFANDLDGKNYAVILSDVDGRIKGFSTVALYAEEFDGKLLRVVYSGDTIIDKAYWGRNEFAAAWIRLVGQFKAEAPNVPLYWLLIVKGHRTYRYLSLFSREYFPRPDVATPPEYARLMAYLAKRRFGNAYDAASGLVLFDGPRSALRPDLAPVPEKDMTRADVRYFLARNPRYADGDELLCLCDLRTDNLTRLARNWFLDGMGKAA